MKKKKKKKDLKWYRKELRKAKYQIRKLTMSMGENAPTFHGFDERASRSTTLNGHKENVRFFPYKEL